MAPYLTIRFICIVGESCHTSEFHWLSPLRHKHLTLCYLSTLGITLHSQCGTNRWLLIQVEAPTAQITLLHNPSLEVIGLSAGYETWHPIGWHHHFVIGWFKDKLGLSSAPLDYGLMWPMGIPPVFQTTVTAPLHCPNGFSKQPAHKKQQSRSPKQTSTM